MAQRMVTEAVVTALALCSITGPFSPSIPHSTHVYSTFNTCWQHTHCGVLLDRSLQAFLTLHMCTTHLTHVGNTHIV